MSNVIIGDFARYRQLKADIAKLEKRIIALEKRQGKPFTDRVTGSSAHHPFTEVHYKVKGLVDNVALIEAKKDELAEKEEEADKLLPRLDEFLFAIDDKDNEIRDALMFYYIRGETYAGVAECMGLEGDGSWIMKKTHEYMRKQNIFPKKA